MKNEQEKSDPSIVAKTSANKPEIAEVDLWGSGAESAERREGTEGNTGEQRTCRTPSRESVSQGLERVREVAKQRKKERFTALLHHVTIDLLKDAYSWLKREAAAWSRWSNMAKLQAEPGGQPSRIAFAHTSGHLSSAPFTTAVHPKT